MKIESTKWAWTFEGYMKFAKKLIFMVLFLSMILSCKNGNDNDDDEPSAKFDDEVVACFNEVNAFRSGNEAWYWNSDNSTKTDLSGKLEKLVLDEKLCMAAQVRAGEIAESFSHTRPDGSSCFSVLKESSIAYSGCGENIAKGHKGGIDTFLQWKEDNYKYSGQGHRRNMLGNYTKIGIAFSQDKNGSYCWAMILVR
ncbi:MAG: CAP domain-containing protein [Treponema sp.]|nr:CAP domain-containing protein [Treponema sp.]